MQHLPWFLLAIMVQQLLLLVLLLLKGLAQDLQQRGAAAAP
jgi:hypothetical protein